MYCLEQLSPALSYFTYYMDNICSDTVSCIILIAAKIDNYTETFKGGIPTKIILLIKNKLAYGMKSFPV